MDMRARGERERARARVRPCIPMLSVLHPPHLNTRTTKSPTQQVLDRLSSSQGQQGGKGRRGGGGQGGDGDGKGEASSVCICGCVLRRGGMDGVGVLTHPTPPSLPLTRPPTQRHLSFPPNPSLPLSHNNNNHTTNIHRRRRRAPARGRGGRRPFTAPGLAAGGGPAREHRPQVSAFGLCLCHRQTCTHEQTGKHANDRR